MGSSWSGRRNRFDAKATTDSFRQLDIRDWNKRGLIGDTPKTFVWSWQSNGQRIATISVKTSYSEVILEYQYRSNNAQSDWEQLRYPVQLSWSSCHFGGARPWFLCPARGCEKRVALLYAAGRVYACRHCHDLTYASRNEDIHDRAVRKANIIEERLGWTKSPSPLNRGKPKGMHDSTFSKLSNEYCKSVQRSTDAIALKLKLGPY